MKEKEKKNEVTRYRRRTLQDVRESGEDKKKNGTDKEQEDGTMKEVRKK